MYLGKVGLHLRNGRTPESDLWVQNSGYAKALDSPGLLAGATGLKSLRLYIGNGNQQWQSRNPVSFADQMIGVAGGDSSIILEPTNECGDDDIVNYLAWLTVFTAHANSRGFHVAGFSFAEGHPANMSVWVTIAQHGFAGVQYLGQHNYWFDNSPNPAFEQFHALRHELANQVLSSAGYHSHPPWLLTEIGQQPGWRNPSTGMSANDAAAQIVAYANHIANDPTVAAACVYTRGGAPDFADFETDPIAHVLWGGVQTDPCLGVYCAPPTYCVNGQCVGGGTDPCLGVYCPPPQYCVNGACFDPGGSLGANEVVGAALVGGVIAGMALFLRRQIHHPTHVRTIKELDRPGHLPPSHAIRPVSRL